MEERIKHCPMCEGELREEFVLEDLTREDIGSCVECGFVTVLTKLIEEE